MLVVATEVVQAPNDKQQLAPMLDKLSALTDHLGDAETLLATAVITGDIRRQHGRQPPFHPLARQKKPLIGNSAQRIKACRQLFADFPKRSKCSINSFPVSGSERLVAGF